MIILILIPILILILILILSLSFAIVPCTFWIRLLTLISLPACLPNGRGRSGAARKGQSMNCHAWSAVVQGIGMEECLVVFGEKHPSRQAGRQQQLQLQYHRRPTPTSRAGDGYFCSA